MQIGKLKIGCARVGFACLGAFAGLDALLRLSLEDYRDSLGTTDGVFDVFNIVLVILDVSMIAFYGIVYVKMRKGRIFPRVMVCHGIFYGLLGLVLCLPFTEVLAPLTPICVLYLGVILTPLGYPGVLGVAAIFVVFNICLVWAGFTSGTKMMSSPRVS